MLILAVGYYCSKILWKVSLIIIAIHLGVYIYLKAYLCIHIGQNEAGFLLVTIVN